MEYLSAEYTEVWVPSRNMPLVRFADRVRPIAATGLDLVELGEACPALETFDSIISWYGSNRAQFRDAVSHLPFTFHPSLPAEGFGLRAVDFYMRQVGGPDGAIPHIECPRSNVGFIAAHPFSGSPRKNWPLQNYLDLASRLPVRFCVGPEQDVPGAVRIDNLYDLGCWLASARAYVGNDSGITHLAAAVGVPVVALFGPTDTAVWAPRGPRVTVICRERLEDIRVEEVIAALC